jgi:hypothetical protein
MSIQTSSMPAVLAPGQLRSLGWKIHSRCLLSSTEQPLAASSTATPSAAASR